MARRSSFSPFPLVIALALVGVMSACGEGPGPKGNSGGTPTKTTVGDHPLPAPTISAVRHGDGWRLTVDQEVPAGESVASIDVTHADGSPIGRREFRDGPDADATRRVARFDVPGAEVAIRVEIAPGAGASRTVERRLP